MGRALRVCAVARLEGAADDGFDASHDTAVNGVRVRVRVDDHSGRVAGGEVEERGTDRRMEVGAGPFDPVEVPATAGALRGHISAHVENDRHVRDDTATGHRVDRRDPLDTETPAEPLVGETRPAEAGTDDDPALFESRNDDLRHVLGTIRRVQQRLGERVHIVAMQEQTAQILAEHRPSGFAGDHRVATLGEHADLGGLADTVATLDDDERAGERATDWGLVGGHDSNCLDRACNSNRLCGIVERVRREITGPGTRTVMDAWARVAAAAARRLHDEPCQDLAVGAWQYSAGQTADAAESAGRAALSVRDLMMTLSAPLSVDDFVSFCDKTAANVKVTVTGARSTPPTPELVAALWVATSTVAAGGVAAVDVVIGRSVEVTVALSGARTHSNGVWSEADGAPLVEALGGELRRTDDQVVVSIFVVDTTIDT